MIFIKANNSIPPGCSPQTKHPKHPKRAVGGLIFRSGFRDVQKVALQPYDFLA